MKIEITINGEAYPCYPLLGAMLRFKKETGKEVTELNATSFTDLCTYLWCCIVSASKHEGKSFDMSLIDFADAVSVDDMQAWVAAIQEQMVEDNLQPTGQSEQKKTQE